MVVAASFWCVFLVDGVIYSYANFEEVLQKDLGVSLTEIMVIPSVAMGVYQMFGPLFSALVNRFGFRLVAFSGGVIASIGECGFYEILVKWNNILRGIRQDT